MGFRGCPIFREGHTFWIFLEDRWVDVGKAKTRFVDVSKDTKGLEHWKMMCRLWWKLRNGMGWSISNLQGAKKRTYLAWYLGWSSAIHLLREHKFSVFSSGSRCRHAGTENEMRLWQNIYIQSGWWFGTFFIFPNSWNHQLVIIIPSKAPSNTPLIRHFIDL